MVLSKNGIVLLQVRCQINRDYLTIKTPCEGPEGVFVNVVHDDIQSHRRNNRADWFFYDSKV